MANTLAFDVYGTLINTHAVVAQLQGLIGDTANDFSHTWREKQLEYTFRRGLMQDYQPFSVCTRHALDFTCLFHGVDLSQQQKTNLLACYRSLPAFEDVATGLKKLSAGNYRLFAFSNGTAGDVDRLLDTAGIRHFFHGVVSVDDVKSFKPNPAVYHHFLKTAGTASSSAWLISSNPFDVMGAMASGMRAAWLKRSASAIFDPWGAAPTTIESLNELHERLASEEEKIHPV